MGVVFSAKARAVLKELGEADIILPSTVVRLVFDSRPNVGEALLNRLSSLNALAAWWAGGGSEVSLSVLRDSASREAERMGSMLVGCEHIVLGLMRVLASANSGKSIFLEALRESRNLLQSMIAESAGLKYEIYPNAKLSESQYVLLIAGVPGAGKSTLAEAIACRLNLPLISMDWLLGSLTPFGVIREENAVPLASHLVTASLCAHIRVGQSTVIDADGHRADDRRRWERLVTGQGARFIGVECVCSDAIAHQERVETRKRDIPGWPTTVSWEHVKHMHDLWEPWNEPHVVVDTRESLDQCIARIAVEIEHQTGP